MDTLALKKTANEIRKGIVTAVHSAKSGQCRSKGSEESRP